MSLLSKKDKDYLRSICYEKKDFEQIETAIDTATIAIFEKGNIDACKLVSVEEATKLVGREQFLASIARAAFHFSSSVEIPSTMERYELMFDAGEMLGGKPSIFKEKETLNLDVKDVVAYQQFPHIYATNIQWDIDEEDIAQDIIEGNLVEKAVGKSEEEIVAEARQYDKVSNEDDIVYDYVLDAIYHNRISEEVKDMFSGPSTTMEIPLNIWAELSDDDYNEEISDYISNEGEYCHGEFDVECNMSIEDMYKQVEFLEEELSKEYDEYGETDFAAAMELEKEEIETAICLMDAEKERNLDETPLEH